MNSSKRFVWVSAIIVIGLLVVALVSAEPEKELAPDTASWNAEPSAFQVGGIWIPTHDFLLNTDSLDTLPTAEQIWQIRVSANHFEFPLDSFSSHPAFFESGGIRVP